MRKDRIEKELVKVSEQIELFQARKRELEQQKQEVEDAESLQIIKKHKISPEQLVLLNKLREDEIEAFLEQKKKEKEMLQNEKKSNFEI